MHKLDTFTDLHRAAQQRMRALIWRLYDDLKAYRARPSARRRGELRARFDCIFHRRTGFATLDRLLARLHANKHELLMVLDRPEIPLHTNGSERDIRLHVTKRKVSERGHFPGFGSVGAFSDYACFIATHHARVTAER